MQIFDLTCLSLTSITFERKELQSSDWTQKTRFLQAVSEYAFGAFRYHFDMSQLYLNNF